MRDAPPGPPELRVLLLAPTARDAVFAQRLLASAGLSCHVCKDIPEVCAEVERGAGAAVVTDEAIFRDKEGCLAAVLKAQPPWSDLPLVVLTPPHVESARADQALESVGHMTLMRRPIEVQTLLSTIRAALRDRRRQYARRDDFAERERQAEDLRTNRERLAFALEAGNLGSWDLDLRSGRIDCTPLFGTMFGLPAGTEMTEKSLLDSIHPEDRPRVEAATRRSLADRTDYHVEYRTVWPDGSVHWVMVRGRAVYDARGKPLRMAGVSLDVTERKDAEEAALKRAGQIQRLAEVSTRLNVAHDVDSVLGLVTEEARLLIGARQAVASIGGGRPGSPALRRASRAGDREGGPGDDTPENGPAAGPPPGRPLEVPLIGRDGKNFGQIRLTDKGGDGFTESDEAILVQLAHMAAVAIENARLYDELRQNDKRKDEFLAMLAHELRNPLAAVNNAVTVLKMSPDEENRNWASYVVERQVKQLVRLIDDLLDVSRITSGKIRLRKEWVDAGPVLRQAVESARPLIDERKHALETSFEEGGLPLHADPTRLEQIVLNLLTNAAKYTGSGGRIWLSAAAEDGRVVIRVRDNGMGIPPEKLPEMFNLFAQGERSIARSEGGLGIGLTIVRKLAEMHGGGVTATSGGPGLGSEFTVSLPAAEPHRSAGGSAPAAARSPGKGSRILVVDDNVDTARGMARLLKLLGNEVLVSYDGSSALDQARTFRPDFVLLDIGLPGMNGYEVAGKLREDDDCKAAVIIAVSGYGQEDDRRRSRAAGFDHHLVKPVDFDSLVSLIGKAQ